MYIIDVLPGPEFTCINLAPTGFVEVGGAPRLNENQRWTTEASRRPGEEPKL